MMSRISDKYVDRQVHRNRSPSSERSSSSGVGAWRSNSNLLSTSSDGSYFGRNLLFSEFWNNYKSSVIYENLCEGCGYGIFESHGKLCDFCRYAVTGRLKESSSVSQTSQSNIYENICEKCGDIFGGDECESCRQREASKCENHKIVKKPTESQSKSNRILSGIFGTLKRVRSRDKQPKHRKLEIVHNVDGYEKVFRTTETFDLNRMCELKRRMHSSSSDHHIYGKLRKSDDHLMNSVKIEQNAPLLNSKSDPNLHKIVRRTPSVISVEGVSRFFKVNKTKSDKKPKATAIGIASGTATGQRVNSGKVASAAGSATKLTTISQLDTSKVAAGWQETRPQSAPIPTVIAAKQVKLNGSVIEWMTSLRRQTIEYNLQLPDDSICRPKNIPAAKLHCYGHIQPCSTSTTSINTTTTTSSTELPFTLFSDYSACNYSDSGENYLRSLIGNDLDSAQLVADFKRKLMDKRRTKRKAIYLKTDGDAEQHFKGVHRHGFYEKDSDFVNELLNVFDFMRRDLTNKIDTPQTPAGSADPKAAAADIAKTEVAPKDSAIDGDSSSADDEALGCCSGSKAIHSSDAIRDSTVTCAGSAGDVVELRREKQQKQSDRIRFVLGKRLKSILSDPDDIQWRNRIVQYLFSNPELIGKRSQMKFFISGLALSRSLNTIVLTYDQFLSAFLSAINCQQLNALKRLTLVKIYRRLVRRNSGTTVKMQGAKRITDRTVSSGSDIHSKTSSSDVKEYRIKSHGTDPGDLEKARTDSEKDPQQTNRKFEAKSSRDKEEDIYQPIWKFQTVGNPRESYTSDTYYDLTARGESPSAVSTVANAEDHGEWETDDEFMFSTKIKIEEGRRSQLKHLTPAEPQTKPSSSSSRTSLADLERIYPFRSICVFYSVTDPKLRAIVYDYDRRRSYFSLPSHRNQIQNQSRNDQLWNTKGGCAAGVSVDRVGSGGSAGNIGERARLPLPDELTVAASKGSSSSSISESCKSKNAMNFIPDCVQAWKFMLLDVNYLDDEEDVFVMESVLMKPEITLQRLKSASTDNILLDTPQEKQLSMKERLYNKFQKGNIKISSRPGKDKKKTKLAKRPDSSYDMLNQKSQRYPIFGARLNEVEMDILGIPRFVSDCTAKIEQNKFIQTDGLYRASGNKTAIDDIKKKLTESTYDPKLFLNEDVHTITGLLKLFFRDLQTPLVPQDLYKQLPENLADKSNLPAIKKILQEVPNPAKSTLSHIIKHLNVVSHYSEENRMPASNLAIVWGPCILLSQSMGPFDIGRVNTLTKILIENFDEIFDNNERLLS